MNNAMLALSAATLLVGAKALAEPNYVETATVNGYEVSLYDDGTWQPEDASIEEVLAPLFSNGKCISTADEIVKICDIPEFFLPLTTGGHSVDYDPGMIFFKAWQDLSEITILRVDDSGEQAAVSEKEEDDKTYQYKDIKITESILYSTDPNHALGADHIFEIYTPTDNMNIYLSTGGTGVNDDPKMIEVHDEILASLLGDIQIYDKNLGEILKGNP